jgi:hypothetical protein
MKIFWPLLIVALLTYACGRKVVVNNTIGAERSLNFPKKTEIVNTMPNQEKVWVFIMAGQSNMAGRGFVAPEDTLPHLRILTINAAGKIILAKEPLHWYEPNLTGLDCGMSFARNLIKNAPKDVSILLIPAAVGGSSAGQWLGDSLYRGVKLMSNFKEKVVMAKRYGHIKALLWHQGESDAQPNKIELYAEKIKTVFGQFRAIVGQEKLPILVAELGSYSADNDYWQAINKIIHSNAATDPNISVIPTTDLKEKGDRIHFDAEGQRLMGKRMAREYVKLITK